MYSVFLVPMQLFHIPTSTYILWLHLVLSVSTVWLLILAAKLLVDLRYALLIGLLSALNPNFVFWTPYILTETQFLFALSLFLVTFLAVLKERTLSRIAGYVETK